jgi:hypothetical protein
MLTVSMIAPAPSSVATAARTVSSTPLLRQAGDAEPLLDDADPQAAHASLLFGEVIAGRWPGSLPRIQPVWADQHAKQHSRVAHSAGYRAEVVEGVLNGESARVGTSP